MIFDFKVKGVDNYYRRSLGIVLPICVVPLFLNVMEINTSKLAVRELLIRGEAAMIFIIGS